MSWHITNSDWLPPLHSQRKYSLYSKWVSGCCEKPHICIYLLYLISMYSQSHVEIEIFLLTSPLLFAYFLLFFAFPCRWRAWPATIAPTLWSLSGICRWSSRSDITVIAGSRPLRLRAIWRKCWPSLQRPKLWRETSTPVTSVTVSKTSRFFTLISRYLQFPPIKHAEKKRGYKLNDN